MLLKSQKHKQCSTCSQNSVSVTFVNVLNSSKSGPLDIHDYDFCEIDSLHSHSTSKYSSSYSQQQNKICNDIRPKKPVILQKHHKSEFKTSILTSANDLRSPENLRKTQLYHTCKMLRLSNSESPALFFNPLDDDHEKLNDISGMACEMNRTFSLIAIDSILYHTFAERLGIDILTRENQSAAIIMDNESESTFLLNKPISISSLTNFLINFKNRSLARYMRSDSVQYKHTHFYTNEDILQTNGVPKNLNKSKTMGRKSRKVSMDEIFSENFEEEVIRCNKVSWSIFIVISFKLWICIMYFYLMFIPDCHHIISLISMCLMWNYVSKSIDCFKFTQRNDKFKVCENRW